MEVMIKGLVFCEKLDIRSAVAHFGFNIKLAGKAAEKWKEKFFSQKRLLESDAKKRGVKIIWENTYENNFELFDEILEVSPDTRFCLDCGHCNCFADFTPVEFIDRYGEKVVHLHLHDNDGKEDSHLPPGSGSVDFSALFNSIGKSKIENAVFEIEPEMYTENINSISEIFKMRRK
jgi:sugar phosphate isomerase/epimerase